MTGLDVRLVNAHVLTMDPAYPVAREIGVFGDRVVGLDDAVSGLPARARVDLRGATVLPGFVDPHVHLAWTGLKARSASVAGISDVASVLAVTEHAALGAAPGEWVDVVGYDQRALGRHLTAAELDRAAAGRKVFLVHDSGHACVVNTAVLDLLPAGVVHERGVLTESGMALVRGLRQPYPLDELTEAVSHATRVCRAEGITTCAEAGIGGGLVSHSPIELAAYQLALERDTLATRVQLMVAADALSPAGAHERDTTARAVGLGMRTGFGGDRLSVGALKVFTDGGMMPRTAALTSPYAGLEHSGQLYDDPEAVRGQVLDGHRGGWQVAIHAIGDRAVDVALGALERAQREYPRPRARHRIEHAGLVRPDQLARFAAVGAIAVVQPTFLWSFGDDYAALMGPERAPWLYRGRGFRDHGVTMAGSSDRPVADGAPLRAVQFMVQRRSSSGRAIGAEEAIGVSEALRAYTADAAYACRLEHELGTIARGKRADLVVLGDDPHRVDPSRIAGIDVVATMLAGEFDHPPA